MAHLEEVCVDGCTPGISWGEPSEVERGGASTLLQVRSLWSACEGVGVRAWRCECGNERMSGV